MDSSSRRTPVVNERGLPPWYTDGLPPSHHGRLDDFLADEAGSYTAQKDDVFINPISWRHAPLAAVLIGAAVGVIVAQVL